MRGDPAGPWPHRDPAAETPVRHPPQRSDRPEHSAASLNGRLYPPSGALGRRWSASRDARASACRPGAARGSKASDGPSPWDSGGQLGADLQAEANRTVKAWPTLKGRRRDAARRVSPLSRTWAHPGRVGGDRPGAPWSMVRSAEAAGGGAGPDSPAGRRAVRASCRRAAGTVEVHARNAMGGTAACASPILIGLIGRRDGRTAIAVICCTELLGPRCARRLADRPGVQGGLSRALGAHLGQQAPAWPEPRGPAPGRGEGQGGVRSGASW